VLVEGFCDVGGRVALFGAPFCLRLLDTAALVLFGRGESGGEVLVGGITHRALFSGLPCVDFLLARGGFGAHRGPLLGPGSLGFEPLRFGLFGACGGDGVGLLGGLALVRDDLLEVPLGGQRIVTGNRADNLLDLAPNGVEKASASPLRPVGGHVFPFRSESGPFPAATFLEAVSSGRVLKALKP